MTSEWYGREDADWIELGPVEDGTPYRFREGQTQAFVDGEWLDVGVCSSVNWNLTRGVAANGHSKTSFEGGGVRDSDKGKERFDLLRPKNVPYADQMLTRFARWMAIGAEKYADRNWEQFKSPEALDRALGSLNRHHEKYQCGETDEDHAAAILANVWFAEYVKGVLDGRWPALESDD